MSWLSIIIALITAVPSLIMDIEKLIAIIAGKPKSMTRPLKQKLMDAIASGDHEKIKEAIAESATGLE